MRQYSWMTKWKQNLWALTEVSGVFALTWTVSGFYHWSWSFLRFFLTLRWGPPAVNSIDCTWFRKMHNCIHEVSARKKMVWSDGTKTELLIHNFEHRVWRKPDVPHHLTPSLLLQWSRVAASCCGGVSQQQGQGDKSREELNGAKFLMKTRTGNLRLGVTLAAKTSQERIRDDSVNVPQWTSQSPEPCWTSARKN